MSISKTGSSERFERFEHLGFLWEIGRVMQRLRMSGRTLLGVLLLGGIFVACGGGADEGAPSGDGDGDMGGDTSARANIKCEPAEGVTEAVCVNDTDCDFVEDGTFRATAKNCLLNSCLGNSDEAGCTADCMVEEISSTLECSTCYGASAACSSEHCLTECFADVDSPGCVECQADSGCTEAFFTCSGLAEPE